MQSVLVYSTGGKMYMCRILMLTNAVAYWLVTILQSVKESSRRTKANKVKPKNTSGRSTCKTKPKS